jgi:hypothetical protein
MFDPEYKRTSFTYKICNLVSGVESAIKNEYIPYGHVAAATEEVQEGTMSTGDVFYNVLNVGGDSQSGYTAGAGSGVGLGDCIISNGTSNLSRISSTRSLIRFPRSQSANYAQTAPSSTKFRSAGLTGGYPNKI